MKTDCVCKKLLGCIAIVGISLSCINLRSFADTHGRFMDPKNPFKDVKKEEVIQEALLKDWERGWDLMISFIKTSSLKNLTKDKYLNNLKKAMANGYRMYYYCRNDKIIGLVGFSVSYGAIRGKVFDIETLIVEEPSTNKEVSNALIRFVDSIAKEDKEVTRLSWGIYPWQNETDKNLSQTIADAIGANKDAFSTNYKDYPRE